MTTPGRAWMVPVAVGLLWASACTVPSDQSDGISVEALDAGLQLVIGERRSIQFQVQGAALGTSDIEFSSSDPDVVRVTETGVAVGVGRGEARIVLTLRAFEDATPDTLPVTVVEAIAFDTVSPDTVRFGEVLTIVGRALDPARLSTLSVGGRPMVVQSLTPLDLSDPSSRDTLRAWVPAGSPERSDLVGLHVTGGSDTWPLTIVQEDVFEPNDDAPVAIDALSELTNPSLAFERGSGLDWYRLRNLPDAFTLEVVLGFQEEGSFGEIELSPARLTARTPPEWTVSYGEAPVCNGLQVERIRAIGQDEDVSEKVTRVSVLNPGTDSLDLVIRTLGEPGQALQYSVRAVEAYVTDPVNESFSVPADSAEPNNHCQQATSLPDELDARYSIDGAMDMDWYRFSVSADSARFTVTGVCSAGCDDVSHFLALRVLQDTDTARPEAPGELPLLGYEWANGAPARLDLRLPAGDYFLAVYNEFFEPIPEYQLQTRLTPISGGSPLP